VREEREENRGKKEKKMGDIRNLMIILGYY
jgi:hypothetical protein